MKGAESQAPPERGIDGMARVHQATRVKVHDGLLCICYDLGILRSDKDTPYACKSTLQIVDTRGNCHPTLSLASCLPSYSDLRSTHLCVHHEDRCFYRPAGSQCYVRANPIFNLAMHFVCTHGKCSAALAADHTVNCGLDNIPGFPGLTYDISQSIPHSGE